MNTILINGREFNKVDLINGFTFTANKYAKKILKDVVSRIPSDMNDTVKGNLDMINAIIECENETEIMALIYIEKNETYFNEGTYKI